MVLSLIAQESKTVKLKECFNLKKDSGPKFDSRPRQRKRF